MGIKKYSSVNVLDAAKARIEYAFDNFDRLYISFSGGKDSSVMMHLVMQEAIKRNRIVGVLIIDLEAQYSHTIDHVKEMIDLYKSNIDLHWLCLPLLLRNAVTVFEPRWICWDKSKRETWVREIPKCATTEDDSPEFHVNGMEFEEMMITFGVWYAKGKSCGAFIGIRCDESLNRFRTIAQSNKTMHGEKRFTTYVEDKLFNVYPIYDWRTEDIWRFHGKFPECPANNIYELMHKAGVPLSQQRLCQPYGDDQRKGLWLYHLLEPQTWFKLIARVNGANSGSLYIQSTGNMTGYNKIACPPGHTWHSFCNMLLKSMPKKNRDHYISRFKVFIKWWKVRGYTEIPEEAPELLEAERIAPSWRRMCKVLLRNDHWCKGLGLTQPISAAYGRYLEIKKEKMEIKDEKTIN